MQKGTFDIAGAEAERQLLSIHVDKAIIGITGIIPEDGCYTAIPAEASIKRIMVQRARESILVLDSSKVETTGFYKSFEIKDISMIVTDNKIPKQSLEMLKKDTDVYTV